MTGTKIFRIWAEMKSRCLNKNRKDYKNYGNRGIKICDEWMKFENFYEDMGNYPKGKSIDRIDNNKGYCKKNCKWSTRIEQNNNKRTNHLLTYQGKTMNITQWSKYLNISRGVLNARIFRYNWSIEKVLSTPVRKFKKSKH